MAFRLKLLLITLAVLILGAAQSDAQRGYGYDPHGSPFTLRVLLMMHPFTFWLLRQVRSYGQLLSFFFDITKGPHGQPWPTTEAGATALYHQCQRNAMNPAFSPTQRAVWAASAAAGRFYVAETFFDGGMAGSDKGHRDAFENWAGRAVVTYMDVHYPEMLRELGIDLDQRLW